MLVRNHGAVSGGLPGGSMSGIPESGIAGKLLKGVMEELKKRGYKAVHLLVAKDNVKALRSYDKLNFENVGECELWGHMYWCYEKAL